MGIDYRELVRNHAEKTGTDPQRALEDFLELLRRIDDQRELGELCQERKLELSEHYDFHYKQKPLPEGVKPIPMDRLSKKYGVWKNRQKKANESVVILVRQANRYLPPECQLRVPSRPRRGGGANA